ncbi:MAG TPA: exosome complex RNA-binding protein Csl4 [archaeon]|nr:exosome complex RNA-binding protein Csl4 [archaeon]
MGKELVFPGSVLGYEEEFVAGAHAFESEGAVFSDSVGSKVLDTTKYEASVEKATRGVKITERGCTVTCIVSLVKANTVLVEIKDSEINGEARVVHDRNGSINVRNMANSYVQSTEDCYRAGDIVKAKVIDVTAYGIELETRAPELGVIKAYGIRSRKPLHLIDGKLRDPATGAIEERKISVDYLLK